MILKTIRAEFFPNDKEIFFIVLQLQEVSHHDESENKGDISVLSHSEGVTLLFA